MKILLESAACFANWAFGMKNYVSCRSPELGALWKIKKAPAQEICSVSVCGQVPFICASEPSASLAFKLIYLSFSGSGSSLPAPVLFSSLPSAFQIFSWATFVTYVPSDPRKILSHVRRPIFISSPKRKVWTFVLGQVFGLPFTLHTS